MDIVLSLAICVVCGGLSARVARNKGRSARAWMIWGVLLGPLPLLLVLLLPKKSVVA